MPPSGGWSGSDARGDGDGLSRSRRYAACARSIAIVARVAHTARRVVRKALGSSVGQRRPMPPPKADHAGCGRARFRASCGGRPTPESTLERSYALLLAHRGVEALAMVDVDTNADTNPAHKNMLRPPTQSQYLNLKTTLCDGLRRLHSSPPSAPLYRGCLTCYFMAEPVILSADSHLQTATGGSAAAFPVTQTENSSYVNFQTSRVTPLE